MKETKYLVAGHTGLVGSAVCRILEKRRDVILATRTHAELDLTQQAEVDSSFRDERPDVDVLAAARVGGILANNTYTAEFIYQNMAIASNAIHSSYRYGVSKLVNLRSSCIYPRFAPQPITEKTLLSGPLEPTNESYAIAKIAALKMCRYYNQQYGTNFMSLMPTNVYGPNENFDLETSHVLPALIHRFSVAARTGTSQSIALWGDGMPRREYRYVDDLAEATVFVADQLDAERMRAVSEDYFVNVGVGTDVTIRELAHNIAEIHGWHGSVPSDTDKPNGTPRKLLDVTAINRLGWTARTSLDEGLSKTAEWFAQNAGIVRQ